MTEAAPQNRRRPQFRRGGPGRRGPQRRGPSDKASPFGTWNGSDHDGYGQNGR